MRSRLVVSCPDRPGVLAAVTAFVAEREASVVSTAQQVAGERCFVRMEVEHDRPLEGFEPVAMRFGMAYAITAAGAPRRVAALVSAELDCVLELVRGARSGALAAEVVLVVADREDAQADVEGLGVAFRHLPPTPGAPAAGETALLEAIQAAQADLVVLAGYTAALSGNFLARLRAPVVSAERAPHAPGAKLVAATARYVSGEPGGGPVVEQEVARVAGAGDAEAVARAGRDAECAVLLRAVRLHLEDRVIVDGPRTVVF